MRKYLLAIALAMGAYGVGAAQIISGMEGARVNDISTGETKIYNHTKQSVIFYLSCDGRNWERVDLAVNKVGEFSCNYSSGIYIQMKSEGGTVEYKLSSYSSYVVYYDSSKRRFDIAKK